MLAHFETFLHPRLAPITVKPLQIFAERRSAAFFRGRMFQPHDLMLPRSPMMFETRCLKTMLVVFGASAELTASMMETTI